MGICTSRRWIRSSTWGLGAAIFVGVAGVMGCFVDQPGTGPIGAGAGGGGSGGGSAPECPKTCDDGDPCTKETCPDGTCQSVPVADNTEVSNAEPDDCYHEVCIGGAVTQVGFADETPPKSASPCVTAICSTDGPAEQNNDGAPCDGITSDNPCKIPACAGGECVLVNVSAGQLPDDKDGDCRVPGCNGMGGKTYTPDNTDKPTVDIPGDCLAADCFSGLIKSDDTDVPVDPDLHDCSAPTCSGGTLGETAAPPGTVCDLPAGFNGECCGTVCLPPSEFCR